MATIVDATAMRLQDIGQELRQTVQGMPRIVCAVSGAYYRGLFLAATREDVNVPCPGEKWCLGQGCPIVGQRAQRHKSGLVHTLMQIACACHVGFGCCPDSTWGTLPQLGQVSNHKNDNPVTVELAFSTSLQCPRPAAPYAVPGRNLISTLRRNLERIEEAVGLATCCVSLRTQGPYS